MKKLLALVLALVMSMSLVTISNAAFKDADSIDYKEAVDVMNAVGVFVGDEKGNFNAKDNLTREQAAKIIAYLELGEKAADALVGSATFTDVAATRWSAGFVSYCAQAGVVSGNGDGTFAPAGQLTALQFGKMLLVEIGYDAKAAGMTGTDWAINTSKLLATTGLMNGIDGSVNQVLTREKAAQMTLNALKTPTVEYATKGSNITVNGAEINFGASVPTYVTNTVAKEQTISNDTLTNSKEYTIELGEKLFKKLVLKNTADAFGRPTHTWTFENKKVGEYTEDADLTYTAGVKLGDIYSDLALTKTMAANDVTFMLNGNTEANSGNDSKSVALTDTALTKGYAGKIGNNGVLTQVWYDDDNGTALITMINTYVGKVSSVTKATSTADRYITITALPALTGLDNKFETEDFAAKDMVSFTAARTGSGYEIQDVALLEKSVSGVMTAWTGNADTDSSANFTVDGTKYKYSAKKYVDSANKKVADFEVDESELDVYLDQYGYALYIEGTTAEKKYAVVIGTGSTNAYGSETKGVTLLFPDGTQKEVTAKLTDGSALSEKDTNVAQKVNDMIGDLVTYTVDSDGVYKLTVKDQWDTTTPTSLKFTNGKSYFTFDGSAAKYTTSETLFFVVTGSVKGGTNSDQFDVASGKKLTYNVYKGYANMPSLDSSKVKGFAVQYSTDYRTQIEAVYIAAESVKGISGLNTFVAFKANADVKTDSTGSYYELPAVVDGEVTTVKMDYATFKAATEINNTTGVYAYSSVVTDKNGIITSGTKTNEANTVYLDSNPSYGWGKAVGVVEANGIVIGVGAKANSGEADVDTLKTNAMYWAYDKDTKIFYVNDAYDTITESSAESIATDILDVVYFTVDSETKVLDTVFIVDKTATNPGTPSTPGTIAGTSSTSSNSDAALKAEAQGAYTFEAGTAFNGISDIAGGIENNIFFKFDTTAANQNVVLKINQSNGTNVYTEGAAPATAGGHYFYVQVTGSALNNAGSGSLKNTALTSGNYTWSITSSGATLVSGTFSIA